MRIPYIGWVTLLMRNTFWALPIVIAIIFILVIAEFVLPSLKPKPKKDAATEEQKQTPAQP